MEQQQSAAKVRRETEGRPRAEQSRGTPERARLSGAGCTLRGVLAGESLLDLPPSRLEELAERMGNQNMAALLAIQARPPELAEFVPPEGEPDTEPLPAPAEELTLPGPPQGLTGGAAAGRAFDPAELAV